MQLEQLFSRTRKHLCIYATLAMQCMLVIFTQSASAQSQNLANYPNKQIQFRIHFITYDIGFFKLSIF